ncbi:1361_t:CDS:2 [Ambispora leptoticha]|uniref:1361_t:CDS:1 n=1 Tax=Ambispora leptoticha TaxID=144679 RepID=A0A9N8ZGV9_9GLOM|nr:1361_t:CDS:2 [Ambispora leptoticha]
MTNSAVLFFYGYELSSYSLKIRNKILINFERILSESQFSRSSTPESIILHEFLMSRQDGNDDMQFDNESALSIHTPVGLHCPLVELLALTDSEKNSAVQDEKNEPTPKQDPQDYNADLYQEKKELIARFHSDLSNPNLRKRLDEIQLEILKRRENKVKNLVQERFNEILDELDNELKEKNKPINSENNENRKRTHENDDDDLEVRTQQNKKQRIQEFLSVKNKTDYLITPRSSFHGSIPETQNLVRDNRITTELDNESSTPPGSPTKEKFSEASEPNQLSSTQDDHNSEEINVPVVITEQSSSDPIKKYYNSPMGLYRDEYGMDIRIPYLYHFRYFHNEIPYILDRTFMTRIELLASKRDAEIQHFFRECGVKVDGLKAKWIVAPCEF